MKHLNLFFIFTMALVSGIFITGCKQEKPIDNKCELELRTTPENAATFIEGAEKGRTPMVIKTAKPRQILVKFEKEGYHPTWELVDLKPGKQTANIKLQPVAAEILLTSEPSEAQVELNGKIIGETPLVLKHQPAGKGSATLKKSGFSTREITWEIKDPRPQSFAITLNSNIGTIAIESTPSEATVYLNDMNCGTTPLTKKIEQGKQKIKVTKAGYADFEDIVICKRGEKIAKTIKLQELPGSINVESDPGDAKVFLNDTEQKRTPCVIDRLEPGKYTVRVEKNGYDPESQDINVKAGKQSTLTFDLGKNTGNIDLVVNPPGITVYVDGEKAGVTEPDENQWTAKVFQLKGLKAGVHTITLAHKRAQPEQKIVKITVKKGQTIRPKSINIWIANAELKHKNGRTMVGCLRDENPLMIIFEPEMGVRQELRRDEIESLRVLKDEE